MTSGVVGRDQELNLGHRLVEAVVGGQPGVLLVEGEAGIGKTALVDAVAADAADRGVRVLRGGAHPFSANRPFGVLAEVLDLRVRSTDPRRSEIAQLFARPDHSQDTAAGPPSSGAAGTDARHRVIEEVIDLVESLAHEGPLAIVLEDLHWADESSTLAVGSLVHALRHVPLLLIGTLRRSPRSPALGVLVDDCASEGAELVRLHPLAAEEVDRLVTGEVGAPPGPVLASIVDRAAGNPLWVVEIVRSLSGEGWLRRQEDQVDAAGDELPGSFRELVLRRLGYLPAAALELLQVASVLGDAVTIQDLAVVTGRSKGEVLAGLEEAFRTRLLDERSEAVVFRHQLVHQAIYEDLPAPKRRALHREAAGALDRSGAELSEVASHLLRGADRGDQEAVQLLRRAAADAAAGAPLVAVELLGRAQELLPRGHADADLVDTELADAMLQAGMVADAASLAESILDRPHDPETDVPLRLTLVSALSLLNRGEELVRRAEAALHAATLDLAQQALILTQSSYGQSFSGDFIGGEATARRAVDLADRAGDTAMAVWSRCALSLAVKTLGRYGEALALSADAVARAFDPLDADARLRHPHFFVGMTSADSDRMDEARAAHGRAIAEAHELGTAWLLPDMLHLSAELHFLVGEWDDASAEIEAGLKLSRKHGQEISIAQSHAYLALMATARGDLVAAHGALAQVEHVLTSEAPAYGSQMVAVAASSLAEAEGDEGRAFDLLLGFWRRDLARDVRYYHRYFGPALVRLALGLDRRDVATDVVATVEAGATLAPEVPTVQSASLRCRGLLDRDPGPLLDAVVQARRGGRLLFHAGACEDAASVLAGAGRVPEATELLLEAHELYSIVDAAGPAGRVAATLRGLGVRQGARGPRRRSTAGWASLTDSERAVADLVAQGLTNREVAQRLHISPHTVNTHLRHVFQKLEVATRAELAARVARRDLTHSGDVSAD